jgi:hypothetical protein
MRKKQHFLLREVARHLGIKPYRVSYALAMGLVAEPRLRIANKRVFAPEDVERLAQHFGVELSPKTGGKGRDG